MDIVSTSTNRHIRLLEENINLKSELDKLKKEYEENTIISSMNDMKQSYEIQERKIDKLKSNINEIYNYCKTAKIMNELICKNISEYSLMRSSKYELKSRIEFIIEILDAGLKVKSEILYIDNLI